MLCATNITWYQTEVEYCKIRLWFTSNTTCGFIYKHILWCTYNIWQNNWNDTFYYLLFTDGWTKSNHKTIELWYSTSVYVSTHTQKNHHTLTGLTIPVWEPILVWWFLAPYAHGYKNIIVDSNCHKNWIVDTWHPITLFFCACHFCNGTEMSKEQHINEPFTMMVSVV